MRQWKCVYPHIVLERRKLLPSHFRCNLGVHGRVEEDEMQHLSQHVLKVPGIAAAFPRSEPVDGDHPVTDLLKMRELHHVVLPPTADRPRRGDGRLLVRRQRL